MPPQKEASSLRTTWWGSGGPAYNRDQQAVINTNQIAWHIVMVDNNKKKAANGELPHPGQQLYLQKGCVACHGADRKGNDTQPSLDQLDVKYPDGRSTIAQIIKQGRGAMPAFGSLSDSELDAILDFLLDQPAGDYPGLELAAGKLFLRTRI